MKIKQSKFTVVTKDDKGDLLLYNSLVGVSSFCCIESDSIGTYFDLVRNEKMQVTPGSQLSVGLASLMNKGVVVPLDVDENVLLHNIYKTMEDNKTLTLIINPTENCNFRCKYCYESFAEGIMPDEIQASIQKYVLDNIDLFDNLVVMWFGGEPLLGLSVIRTLSSFFIQVCRDAKKSYHAHITTNGMLLSYEVFLELVKLHVTMFQITIDAPKKIHDAQRVDLHGNGTYDTILSNLKCIKTGRKYPVHIVLRTNFTLKTIKEIDSYLYDFCSLFSDDKRFSFDIHMVGNWLGKTDKSIIDDLGDSNCYRTIFKKILNHPNGVPNLTTMQMNPREAICVAARKNSYLLSSSGIIHKCTLIFEDKESSLGSISKDNGLEISKTRDELWFCRENYCNSEKSCKIAPLCLGETCPLNRIRNIRSSEQKLCPELKLYIDLYLQCLHKYRPFERVVL